MDDDGFVTEGASTNAWIVDADGTLITRDLANAILPGVTRRDHPGSRRARRRSRSMERKFTVAEAQAAREAFLSSATGAAVPVVAIDGDTIGDGTPGPLTRRIRELYAAQSRHRKARTLAIFPFRNCSNALCWFQGAA